MPLSDPPVCLCLLRVRTLCLSRTSTCPTWMCRTGWLTATTVCRASWAARAKSWAASKSLCRFTPAKSRHPKKNQSGGFRLFFFICTQNWKLGIKSRSCTQKKVKPDGSTIRKTRWTSALRDKDASSAEIWFRLSEKWHNPNILLPLRHAFSCDLKVFFNLCFCTARFERAFF